MAPKLLNKLLNVAAKRSITNYIPGTSTWYYPVYEQCPEAEDMCIDSTSEVTVTRVLAYSARTITPRLYGNLSGFHSVTAASS